MLLLMIPLIVFYFAAIVVGKLLREVTGRAVRDEFCAASASQLDPFQIEALDALDRGCSVLVSAPTGAGKTLVAAYGVHVARAAGQKAFYTTPLKALSNQKFADLCAEHGDDAVGLLTGDVSIRPCAPIVVMTTEVLRNMLLTGSPQLEGLGVVVLDEVHFLQDPYRGGVWEEVLILTPRDVTFVCLSATVANADGPRRVARGRCGASLEVVVERTRPIDLHHHVTLERRNDDAPRARRPARRTGRERRGASHRRGPARVATARVRGPAVASVVAHAPVDGRPRRSAPRAAPRSIELLEDKDLLPCIYFIFSRAACEDAVRQCVREGMRLLDRSSRRRIRAIAEERTADLGDEDLEALGWHEWLEALESRRRRAPRGARARR